MCTSVDGYVSEHVIIDSDPARLLERLRAANRGGDVHLVGGPRTIETYRALGALDQLGVIVLPLMIGGGMQLTPEHGGPSERGRGDRLRLHVTP
jgi:dihydrofolate reductase